MDNGLLNGVIFLDLKKAFDTVDHTILIHKLKTMGVSGVSLAWFQSYLTSRFQRTVIGQAMSCNRRVSVGVPQGSILGPLLFSIYINNLPTCLKRTSVTLFADDTALYCSAKSSSDLQQMIKEEKLQKECAVASWLVRSTPERALRVRAQAGDIVLCS